MKFFSRKKASEERVPSSVETPDSEQGFYTQPVGEAPLNEFAGEYERNGHRTSLHSAVRRRETSNRVNNREIFSLFARTGLIIFFLVAGFFGLKIGLGKLAGPSEKDQEQWAANAALMEGEAALEGGSAEAVSALSQAVTVELLGTRLQQWGEAERNLRAAKMRERGGMDKAAASRLEQVLRFVPEHRAAQRLLMRIQMRSENYAAAVPLCIRLLDQDSQQWDVKVSLLHALQKLGQTEECLVLAERMLEQEPNNLELLGLAARAHQVAGNGEEALALFDRILQNDGRHLMALEGSGAIYQERGNWEKATPYYLELVRTHPQVEYYRNVVRGYAQMEEASKAIIFMGQAASLYGESEVSNWLLYDLGDFDLILETVEYRSFADRVVGVDARKAIEDIRRRAIEKKTPAIPGEFDFPTQPELKLSPNR